MTASSVHSAHGALARRPRRALLGIAMAALTAWGGAPRAAWAEPWTRRYIDALPDAAFAAVETTADGKTVRHLPHHDGRGRVDLPHVRNALSRLPQVRWIDPRHAAAAHEHLDAHLRDAREKPR